MVDIGIMRREAAEEDSRASVAVVHKSKKLEGTHEVGEQELLPRIPNMITLELIAPKLPWATFHVLSLVSRGWLQAIRSRQVYDARVRNQSRQTLVVMNDDRSKDKGELALYSLSDGASYHLPAIPGLVLRLPWSYQCISLNGKLYVLGGYGYDEESSGTPSAKVYMLDLVEQRHWKQCASMADPRACFGCGVFNGKVYVFGGTSSMPTHCGSEVYDPESDAWSPIAPMKPIASFGLFQVVTVGEELFVQSGRSHFPNATLMPLEVYSPLKNQWRSTGHLVKHGNIIQTVGGKLHKLENKSIQVLDSCANSWKHLKSFSYSFLDSRFHVAYLLAAVVVDDGFLGVVNRMAIDRDQDILNGFGLMRSQGLGLGCQSKDVAWLETQCSMSFHYTHDFHLRPIQL